MCINQRFVRNQYTGKSILVKCGHCPACLQEKANKRRFRLLNHKIDGYDVYFFHLTYEDSFLPFFYIDDVCEVGDRVPIYRRMDVDVSFSKYQKKLVYNYLYDYDNPDRNISEFEVLPYTIAELTKLHEVSDDGRIGVLVYSDVQKFFKRLRSRLNRIPDVSKVLAQRPLYYFVTGEYGENFSRPHWHILLYVPALPSKYGFEFFKSTCVSCWPYAYDYVTERRFEYAVAPETYVSRYVNCSVDVSPFLLRSQIRPVWHYSHNFGTFNPSFYLRSMLEKIRKRNFEYIQKYPLKNGRCRDIALPFPSYVTSRFFPDFKGRFRLSYTTMHCLISNVLAEKIRDVLPYTFRSDRKITRIDKSIIRLSYHTFKSSNIWQSDNYLARTLQIPIGDVYQVRKVLHRCYNLYLYVLGLCDNLANRLQYADDFIAYLQAKFRYFMIHQFDKSLERDVLQSYDDIAIVAHCKPDLFKSAFPGYSLDSPWIVSPNKFVDTLNRTHELNDTYNLYVKSKKMTLCQKS